MAPRNLGLHAVLIVTPDLGGTVGAAANRALTIALGALLAASCRYSIPDPVLHPPTEEGVAAARARQRPAQNAQTVTPIPTIKLHLHSGQVVLFDSWDVDSTRAVIGVGQRFDTDRTPLDRAKVSQRVPLDSVALVESDSPATATSFSAGMYHVWTTTYGAVTGLCIADPKSCFGSCPTFYVDGEDAARPRAEGFSSSIARRLEATDIDDLELIRPGGASVGLRMLNEAWETHAVRWVRLHAVPRAAGSTVLAAHDGGFRAVTAMRGPESCRASGGDCRASVATRDTAAWHDVTDGADLAATDTMLLSFTGTSAQTQGLVLAARQSFVSTFVLYQTMAWLGADAGNWLARLERGEARAMAPLVTVEALIGAITVQAERADGSWQTVARFDEHGPIATDRQVIALPRADATPSRRLRLIYAKGNWRIDQAAIADLGDAVTAVTLSAVRAERTGPHAGDVRAALADSTDYTVTLPGDSVAMRFDLPDAAAEYALFLESRGYYLEWMRGEWLAEGDATMAQMLMQSPREALRLMAPMYKTREANYEKMFWASRFGGVR